MNSCTLPPERKLCFHFDLGNRFILTQRILIKLIQAAAVPSYLLTSTHIPDYKLQIIACSANNISVTYTLVFDNTDLPEIQLCENDVKQLIPMNI